MKIKNLPSGSQVYAAIRYPADRGTGKWEGYTIADENGVAEIDLDMAITSEDAPIIVQIRDIHHITAKIVPAFSTPTDDKVYTLPKSDQAQDEFDCFMEE